MKRHKKPSMMYPPLRLTVLAYIMENSTLDVLLLQLKENLHEMALVLGFSSSFQGSRHWIVTQASEGLHMPW